MDKWTRWYQAEAPPWCSGKPSTHLARFLRTGSVRTDVAPSSSPSPSPSPPRVVASTPPRDALDLGCGSNGTNVALLAAHGYRAAGVDLVPEAVARARRGAAEWLARDSGVRPPLPSPEMAFAAADLLQLPLRGEDDKDNSAPHLLGCWDDVHRMEEEQLEQHAAADAADATHRRRWSLLFDCQTYHVLRTITTESEVVARYRSLLEPGGVLVLLCGRPPDDDDDRSAGAAAPRSVRADGPNEVALGELRAAFCPAAGWREREIAATRFDPTPAYDRRPGGPPLAWAAVFERA